METKWENLLYEKIDNVARIYLNRPEVRNAQSKQLLVELDGAFRQAEADDDVKVIILAGKGPHFSAGHDLGSPQRLAEDATLPNKPRVEVGYFRELDLYLGLSLRWRDIPKPTIAQVHGACIAAGAMLAAVCDLIVASDDAKFSDPVVRMGVGGVEYFYHPWDLGFRKAKEMLFTGDFIGAQEAMQRGFVNRVVTRDQLEDETLELAKRIALMPSFGLAMAKASVNETMDNMGFRNSMANIFKAHHLAHAYNAEVSGGRLINPVGQGQSIAEWAKQRDKAFEEKK